jgi:shikimate kinase / 3-dehydroquinate synthase
LADHRNIILTGFMGTGKTSVGRLVAERLGWQFVDLDERIEAAAGKPVPAIFAEDGEPAFRDLETAACRAVGAESGLVIATGGGAVLRCANRDALIASGTLICLEASPEAILRRVGTGAGRPVLGGGDRVQRIQELLAERAGAYNCLPHHIDTSELAAEQVAERVLALTADLPEGAYRVPVLTPEGGYDILIAEGLLGEAGTRLVAAGVRPGRCTVITNPTVAGHHLASLMSALTRKGFESLVLTAPDGEAYKTLATVADLYRGLAEAKMARDEAIIALGGGVIGDMAGFVAATWLRGAPFVQVPTSLLSMVDASVGGKVAVDLPQGKNLVGAFKQPELVLIDPDVLATLPAAEFRSGLAEVVKAGIIGDPLLFTQLMGDGPATLTEMIGASVRVKAELVRRDPYEAGNRAWLNLGHTFGHALELVSGFSLRHGEGVSIGMVAAAALSERLGIWERPRGAEDGMVERLQEMLDRLGLPTSYAFDEDAVLAAMGTDKKRRGRNLRFVVIERIGKVALVEGVAEEDVRHALRAVNA